MNTKGSSTTPVTKLKNNKINFIHLLCAWIFFQINTQFELKCQFQTFFYQDTASKTNLLNQIFDKQFNIFRLSNIFSLNKTFKILKINLFNNYEGYIIKTNEISKKEVENIKIEISGQALPFLDIFYQSNFFLNTDSKNIGLNEAEKINNNLGLTIAFPKYIKSFVSYGLEKNKQVYIEQTGPRLTFGTNIDNLSLTEINLTSQMFFERIDLRDGRKNNSLVVTGKIHGEFEDNNSIYLSLDYNSYRRDYIVIPIYLTNFFETRLENKLIPNFGLIYNLFKNTTISFFGNLNFHSIRRFYNIFDPTNFNTAIEKILLEYSTDMNIELNSQTEYFSPRIALNYYFRTEENTIDKRFEIDNQSFTQLSTTEFQKNNIQSRLSLLGNLTFTFHKNNITNLSGNISILRYDTPSKLNDDDRDELTILAELSTNQKFSQYYTLALNLDIQLNHLVFLKSSKSSLNNWNRIIKFGATSNYSTEFFSWKPTLEVFSNYLVYDFEFQGSITKSFAFRQFVYKDTFEIAISNSFSISNFLTYKFSERGKFFWNSFSMTKEMEINEFFNKTMFYYENKKNWKFGIGARIYNIKQIPKGKSPLQETYAFYSFSPETEIKISLSKDNVIFLQGWYELKFWNYKIVGENPNLMLVTKVSF